MVAILALSVAGVTFGCQPSARIQAIIHLNNGNALYNEHKIDEAIAEYDKAIALDPNYSYAYNNRGAAYEKKGIYNLAMDDYTKAIELNPNDESLNENKEQLKAYLGRIGSKTITSGRVSVFPSSATITLGAIPTLVSFTAMVDGKSIGVDNKDYTVEWLIDNRLVYTREFLNKPLPMLTTEDLLKCVNSAGTYIVKARVRDKAGNFVSENTATLIVKGQTTIAGSSPISNPLSGTWKGTLKHRTVGSWGAPITLTTDIEALITMHLKQKEQYVEGIIILSDVKERNTYSDPDSVWIPLVPPPPVFARIGTVDGSLTGKIDSQGNINLISFTLQNFLYTPNPYQPQEQYASVSISGDSMTFKFGLSYDLGGKRTNTGSFTVTKVSDRYDDSLFP
jgi:tetratricopeptide (TPR) repeat protein